MILRGTLFSHKLEMSTGITIATPDTYLNGMQYKVAYLLHGLAGNNTNIVDSTLLNIFAENYKCIFIMPETARSLYTDMVYGQKYFTYISEELPYICKSVFNISSAPKDTYIMGISMGGYGALKCALANPGHYKKCCVISAAFLFIKDFLEDIKSPGGEERFLKVWGSQFLTDIKAAFGQNLNCKNEDDLLWLAGQIKDRQGNPKFYSICGSHDRLLEPNRIFSEKMKAMGFKFEYEEQSGGHEWRFFNSGLEKALKFCFENKQI